MISQKIFQGNTELNLQIATMLNRRKDKEKKTGVKSNKKPASYNQIFSCLGNFFNISNRLEVTNSTNFTVCE